MDLKKRLVGIVCLVRPEIDNQREGEWNDDGTPAVEEEEDGATEIKLWVEKITVAHWWQRRGASAAAVVVVIGGVCCKEVRETREAVAERRPFDFGRDAKTGLNRYLTPWKTSDDPSSGDYEFKLDINDKSVYSRLLVNPSGVLQRYTWIETSQNMKLLETSSAFMNQSMSLSDCEMVCKRNCSCTAYATMDIVGGGSGCVIWTGAAVVKCC
ncbi:uncharacterized protein LOC114259941 [Camellia sinensis]|uniref:uncharacterized protein LOC114259941 n=1 Tax=Camellia sinensis TaxID=4442 RepID=UPI001036356E|nr:uncharacterized protein LOC114259941 [Camellia sinensis]